MCAHLDGIGEAYRTFEFPEANVKQILLTDPDNVELELNFMAG